MIIFLPTELVRSVVLLIDAALWFFGNRDHGEVNEQECARWNE
jgi:hypothetical protein